MTYRTTHAGEVIIKEGEEGDEMYLVDCGVFAVLKRDESSHDCGVNQEVFRYTTSGASFGELRWVRVKIRASYIINTPWLSHPSNTH